jgi:hypothetical protein
MHIELTSHGIVRIDDDVPAKKEPTLAGVQDG